MQKTFRLMIAAQNQIIGGVCVSITRAYVDCEIKKESAKAILIEAKGKSRKVECWIPQKALDQDWSKNDDLVRLKNWFQPSNEAQTQMMDFRFPIWETEERKSFFGLVG